MISPFKAWKRYRNKYCLDIDMDIVGPPVDITDAGTTVVVIYWNRVWHAHQGGQDKVVIKREHYDNWTEIS